MRAIALSIVALVAAGPLLRADFSYTTTRKSTGGAMAGAMGAAANQSSRYYFKGQKLKVENGDTATILDFDAQTVTIISNTKKSYSVLKFSDFGQVPAQSGIQTQVDVKETGQKKAINGFNARELEMTMDVEMNQGRAAGMKMQMTTDTWISPDVPGAQELRDFYRRNADRFPWSAMAEGANPQMQSQMAEVQRKMAAMDGVPVLQVMKVKAAGGPAMPQMTAAQSAQMEAARARLEAMVKQGGPAAAMMQQQLDRMNAAAGGGSSGSLMETTMESSDFSTAGIPDSVFAIPAGYREAAPRR